MAYTQADVVLLERALIERKGAASVTFSDGQSVSFVSYKEMQEFLASLRRSLAGSTTRYVATDKDL